MKYVSTRGKTDPVSFKEAVMMGLAPDKGLLVPESIPQIQDKLEAWKSLSYTDLAFEIMSLFTTDMPDEDLKKLIATSYSTFDADEVTPVVKAGDKYILELFHGPTLAFKDVALQFLGNIFEYILEEQGGELNILGATSGDTGSAAIYGVRGKDKINIFVMHPHNRVSPVQERQMTSVLDSNVYNIAIDGSFDDAQSILKETFADLDFKNEHSLGAVNSVNWCRILGQVVYYFYGAFRVQEETGAEKVQFSVPTGNFGDIFAGYIAYMMGAPIQKLILATNENDILNRFFNTGKYEMGDVNLTISPSMDIQIASNFERWCYFHFDKDSVKLTELFEGFASGQPIAVDKDTNGAIDPIISAGIGETEGTLAVIKKYWEEHNYLLDPHTAVGVYVAEKIAEDSTPVICLATAHPAKFKQAIIDATGEDLAHHSKIDGLDTLPTRCEVLPADINVIKDYMDKSLTK